MKSPVNILALMCLSLAALLTSCSMNGGSTDREPQCLQKDTVVYLSADKKGPSCKLSLTYTYLLPESEADSVTSVINSTILKEGFGAKYASCTPEEFVSRFANGLLEDYLEDVEDLYKADVKRGAKDYPSWLDYEYDFKTSMKSGADDVWCYTVTAYSYTGGAHGNTFHTCLNVNAKTGQLITLDDLFRKGCEEEICDLIREALTDGAYNDASEASTHEELERDVDLSSLFIPNNFILEKDCVTFVYNTYDIASYTAGSFWPSVPLSKLKDYMK